jgi:hypothetical protein
MAKGIVEDFKDYALDPARWVHRYQKQCRFYAGDWKENYNAKGKKEDRAPQVEVPV